MAAIDPRKLYGSLIQAADQTPGLQTMQGPTLASMGAGGTAPAGPIHGGGSNFTGAGLGGIAHDASGAQTIYDALVKAATGSSVGGQLGTGWLTQYKDQLLNSIIPAARAQYGDAGIMNLLNNHWKKAIYGAYSAATGTPFYDKTGDGSMGNLLFINGFKPNAPSQAAAGSPGLWV